MCTFNRSQVILPLSHVMTILLLLIHLAFWSAKCSFSVHSKYLSQLVQQHDWQFRKYKGDGGVGAVCPQPGCLAFLWERRQLHAMHYNVVLSWCHNYKSGMKSHSSLLWMGCLLFTKKKKGKMPPNITHGSSYGVKKKTFLFFFIMQEFC